MSKRIPGSLPEGWTLKDGFINYNADNYHKHILDKSGRIDRNAVALTLENYGYPDHARRWFLSPVEMAAPELLEALKMLADHLDYRDAAHYHGSTDIVKRAREVIAKAEGVTP